ncbi:glycoside hydrolase family 3 N-terminal domain-containing protein [Sphingomonas sp. PvP055]|uniref:glycoside hydrolase family 3 protein n=1 Tax=Sphingomonas sp. PvP055 TaxID=3156391 RepID=UPI003399510D
MIRWAATALIRDGHMTSLITRLAASGRTLAEQNNALQGIAAGARIAVPLTISTDPRNHFQVLDGASVAGVAFSKWPEATGFGAIGDAALVERFGDIARQEYRAAGIQQALSPMADLATEPRWSRINGTFGEDPDRVSRLVGAYVRGFQHGAHGLMPDGVSAVVKHWVGYGASEKGYDGHSWYGRYAALSDRTLALHTAAFRGAFAAGVTGVMPTYAIVKIAGRNDGRHPAVGAAFSPYLLTDLLRGQYRFGGFVLSDWGVTRDCGALCRDGFPAKTLPTREGFSTAWGMESVTVEDRFVRAIAAGVDQFGGTTDARPIAAAVRAGRLPLARIDASVRRMLALKFRMGLFENPYVDPAAAERIVGAPGFRAEGLRAQSRALVVLKADAVRLASGTRVYLVGVDPAVAVAHGLVPVARPEDAARAVIRLAAPWRGEHTQYYYGAKQHEGRLSWAADDPALRTFMDLAAKVPTIAVVYLDRPAILTPLLSRAGGLVADFGASDAALLDALTGRVAPEGRLPFELPSSEAAVDAQAGDVPHDSQSPLFPIGFGLTLSGTPLRPLEGPR